MRSVAFIVANVRDSQGLPHLPHGEETRVCWAPRRKPVRPSSSGSIQGACKHEQAFLIIKL